MQGRKLSIREKIAVEREAGVAGVVRVARVARVAGAVKRSFASAIR